MTTTTVSTLPANLPPAFQAMINTLTDIAGSDEGGLGASISIADGILAAAESGDEDAIFGAANAGTISGEDYVGTPFYVRHDSVQWRKTGEQFMKEGAFPYYALIRTEDAEGNSVVINCGGQSVVPTLFALWDAGILEKYGAEGMPLILREITTGGGWSLLKLHKYDAKAA